MSALTIPPLTWWYGWNAENPPRQVTLNPADPIPDEVLLALSPDNPVFADQDPEDVLDAFSTAMVSGPALALASALAAAAGPGVTTIAQASAALAAGPSPLA